MPNRKNRRAQTAASRLCPAPQPSLSASDFDNLYFERMQAALATTVDAVSTAPVSGMVWVKPVETIAALATMAGRILGIAENASGVQVTDAMVDNFRSTVAANLGMARAVFALARAERDGAQPATAETPAEA